MEPLDNFHDGEVDAVMDWENEEYGAILNMINSLNNELKEG